MRTYRYPQDQCRHDADLAAFEAEQQRLQRQAYKQALIGDIPSLLTAAAIIAAFAMLGLI